MSKPNTKTTGANKARKTEAAIEAAGASLDAAPTDDSGKMTLQFEAMGKALFAAASIAPLSLEILTGISDKAATMPKQICTQYRTLLRIAGEGITEKEKRDEETREMKALSEKMISSGKTPEEIAAFIAS